MTTFAHARNYCLDTARPTKKIGLHDLPEHRHRHLFHRPSGTYPCIVHKNVDATVLRKHLADRTVDRGVVIHIERSHLHGELLSCDDLLKFMGPIQISHRRNDFVAATRERHGGRKPDAAAGAGDQCDGHCRLPTRRNFLLYLHCLPTQGKESRCIFRTLSHRAAPAKSASVCEGTSALPANASIGAASIWLTSSVWDCSGDRIRAITWNNGGQAGHHPLVHEASNSSSATTRASSPACLWPTPIHPRCLAARQVVRMPWCRRPARIL